MSTTFNDCIGNPSFSIQRIKILLVSENTDYKIILCSQFNISMDQLKQVKHEQIASLFKNQSNKFIPDLIITDLDDMPQVIMLAYLKQIKSIFNAPILGVISVTSLKLTEEVLSFPDDLIFKPFCSTELWFRVLTLYRMVSKVAYREDNFILNETRMYDRRQQKQNDKNIHDPVFFIDGNNKRIYFKNKDLELGPKAYELLLLLLSEEMTVTNESILAKLWPENKIKNKNNEICIYINKLRRKIENNPHHPCWIKTIKGIGYKFMFDKKCE